jgi:hypothetical protein
MYANAVYALNGNSAKLNHSWPVVGKTRMALNVF